ncbi:MAG: hypothetical protein AAGF02_03940 [Actinomycetota bacterium]
MTDLDHELSRLATVPVPDRWDDIAARAAEPEPMVIEIGPLVDGRSRRWLAAAAIVLVAGAVLLGVSRQGSDGGVATTPPRTADEPALLDLPQPVQPSDTRRVNQAFDETDGTSRVVVLGVPTADGYEHLVAVSGPVPDGFDPSDVEGVRRLADDPIPGVDLFVNDFDGRGIVQALWNVDGTDVVLSTIAPVDAVRELVRTLDRHPAEIGERFGAWEVAEVTTGERGGAWTYSEVTTTVEARETQLVSNPASRGGPLAGVVFLAADVERVEVDGRTAWYGTDWPVLTWSVPGGGTALLLGEGTADELTAVADSVVELTPEEWAERAGTFPDDPVTEAPTTTMSPPSPGDELPTLRATASTPRVATPTTPHPELDGWTVEASQYLAGDPDFVGWWLTRDGIGVGLNVTGGPAAAPDDWELVRLDRDGIELAIHPDGGLTLWNEPDVGAVQQIAIDVDRSVLVEMAEQLAFVEREVPAIPFPEPVEPFDEVVSLERTLGDRSVELTATGESSTTLWFDGHIATWAGPLPGGRAPIVQIVSIDELVLVAVHLPDQAWRVHAFVEGDQRELNVPIEDVGAGRVALFGVDPSANGATSVVVVSDDEVWPFEIPVMPPGWATGLVAPTG